MRKKTKRKNVSVLSATDLKGEAVFFCHFEKNSESWLALCRKTGSVFKEIGRLNIYVAGGGHENLRNCSEFRIFRSGRYWFLVYIREYTKLLKKRRQTVIARSSDMVNFHVVYREDNWELEAFTAVINHGKNYFLAYLGGKTIKVAASRDLKNWHATGALIHPRKTHFDDGNLHVLDAIVTNRGILVIYEPKKRTKLQSKIQIGGALFSESQPYKMTWRCEDPILEKRFSGDKRPTKYLGAVIEDGGLKLYWLSKEGKVISAAIKTEISGIGSLKKRAVHLKRHLMNPIIKAKAENSWEYDSTFNPAAIHLDEKIHLLYRAIGSNGVSVFGYASTNDGYTVHERLNQPAFAAMNFSQYSKEDKALYPSKYVSGGSWIGCEDPRVTKIGNRIYMTYTSFDGCNPPCVSLTWIDVEDFLQKKWNWKRPVQISKQGEIQKNWMLFPEKINGKFAILHSITPQISIEYVDDIEAEGVVIESVKKPGKDEHRWDNIVRGAGAPPMKTDLGWLVLYHAMDRKDPNRYKVGAMILDYEDPTRVLYRSNCPILEPDEEYENVGAKRGVVYVCGAVIRNETLFVYYGGADSVVCVATADLKEFLKDMTPENSTVKMEKLLNKKKASKKEKAKEAVR